MDAPEVADDSGSYYAILGVAPSATDEEVRRAYRTLAASLHPDKAQDPDRRQDAAELFSVIQEAYEVLSNPEKRDIYDIYGKAGLEAGLEVGERVKTKDELRKEWEKFREQQEKQRVDAQVNYRGAYIFRTDASALVKPYSSMASRVPDLTNIYMTSGVDIPVDSRDWGWLASEQDAVHLGGLVSLRKNVGGGSFLAGYKRVYADYSTLDANVAVGLKGLVSLSSTIQLSAHATAALTGTWSPDEGVGLQLVTTRQLSQSIQGEYAWVVGPESAAGMSLALTRRLPSTLVTGRVEVGASTGFLGRVARRVGSKTTARGGLKLTLAGAELDLGASHQLSDITMGGMHVVAGSQGIVLKLRYNRAGHAFEFPIVLSHLVEWPVLLAAYAAPALSVYVCKEWILGPVRRSIRSRKLRTQLREQATAIEAATKQAAAAAELLGPVATRRTRQEAARGGLVVCLAVYGAADVVGKALAARVRGEQLGAPAEPSGAGGAEASAAARPDPSAANGSDPDPSASTEQPSSPAAKALADELPPAAVDVTVAVQYMVEAGRIVLYQGYAKSGLMGFCDPAPGSDKELVVLYSFKGEPKKATFQDREGGGLPARGERVQDEAEAAFVARVVEELRQV